MSIGAIVLVQVKDARPEGLRTTPLEDATLVHLGVPFGDEGAIVSAIDESLSLEVDLHRDDRGLFVLPDVAAVEARRYDDVVEELGPAGYWISLGPTGEEDDDLDEEEDEEDGEDEDEDGEDEDEDGEDEDEEEDEELEVRGANDANNEADLDRAAFAAAGRLLDAMGPNMLLEMQRALQEGDVRKLAELRSQLERAVGGAADLDSLAASIFGLMAGNPEFDPDSRGGGGGRTP